MKSRFLCCISICAFSAATLLPSMVSANPITKTLTLNVYQVCDDSGANCASTGPAGDIYFAAATNKIWAQAGISVDYNFAGKIDNSLWFNIDDQGFTDIAKFTGHYQSSSVVDMFLVNTLNKGTDYGEGWLGSGGLVMGMETIMGFGSGGGRIDTMAHELGHNLGLDPFTDPESDKDWHSINSSELMASGTIRIVPLTLGDINPSGAGYDQLSQFQIDYARNSSLLQDFNSVPEPGSMALMIAGVLGIIGTARCRRKVLEVL
jgi:hypothetical protein